MGLKLVTSNSMHLVVMIILFESWCIIVLYCVFVRLTHTCEDQHKQALLIVLDTNVLLSHLEFVKKIRSHGLGGKKKIFEVTCF